VADDRLYDLRKTRLSATNDSAGYGAGRIPGNGVKFDKLEASAEAWFKHVFDTLGVGSFKDKEKVLRAVPMLAAIGAVGRSYYEGDAEAQRKAREVIADPSIDWSVGPHWSGICGKINPNTGKFAVGSAKEYGNAAFNALTQTGTDLYSKIRPSLKAKAA
jgi:hypothetical protein